MSMGDGKAKNVLEYLDNLVEKGKASKGAIAPLKVAFAKVVQTIDGDGWEDVDVKSIDLEDYMNRFSNLTMGRYSSDSLVVYKSRANKVLNWYAQFIDKPGWTPDVARRTQTAKSKPTIKPTPINSKHTQVTPAGPSQPPEISHMPNRVIYPYPLLDGQLIQISLPIKLTKKDAIRIAAFVESIAVDEPLAIGPGNA